MPTQALPRVNEDEISTGPITVLRTQLEQRAEEFRMVLPSHISPAKFQRTVLTAVQNDPSQQLLRCERRSLLTACLKAAQDGLLPDGWDAAIVPFNTRMKVEGQWQWVKLAQYMPMVAGLRKKILQSGEVIALHAAVVYRQELEGENPRFIYREGSEHKLYHAPIVDMDFRPKDEDIALAYSVATLANGYQSYEVMRRWEIDEVRESSQTGAQFDAKGEPRDAKGPWVDWFSEMAKKTVIRRHAKSLPQSSDIIADVEAEDMAYAHRSAQALLESAKPEPAIIDSGVNRHSDEHLQDGNNPKESGPPYRPRDMDDAGQPVGDIEDEPPPPEPKQETRRGPGRPRKEPTPEPEPEQDLEERLPPPLAQDDEPEPEPEPEESEADFISHEVKSEDERKADDYVSRAKACDLLTDFRKLEREAEMDLAEMPVHLASIVDTVFEQTRKRLSPRKN